MCIQWRKENQVRFVSKHLVVFLRTTTLDFQLSHLMEQLKMDQVATNQECLNAIMLLFLPDYMMVNQTQVIDMENPMCSYIITKGDSLVEGDETYILSLSSNSHMVVISEPIIHIIIIDNDCKYKINAS